MTKKSLRRAASVTIAASVFAFALGTWLYLDLPEFMKTDLAGDGMLSGCLFFAGLGLAAILGIASLLFWWLSHRN